MAGLQSFNDSTSKRVLKSYLLHINTAIFHISTCNYVLLQLIRIKRISKHECMGECYY